MHNNQYSLLMRLCRKIVFDSLLEMKMILNATHFYDGISHIFSYSFSLYSASATTHDYNIGYLFYYDNINRQQILIDLATILISSYIIV